MVQIYNEITIYITRNFSFGGFAPEPPLGARLPPDLPAEGIAPPDPAEGVPPSALPRVEECTYFWGISTAGSKRPLNQEDNQAPQPTL